MRVLSFIPAFLLAAASFVAAAPTATDSSCAPTSTALTGGNGSDNSLQPVISLITGLTADIQTQCDKLTSMKGTSDCTPDNVSGVVVSITASVSTCVQNLQQIGQINLTGVFLGNLCTAIYGLLSVLCVVVNTLVVILLALGASAIATLQSVVCNLLNAVLSLVACLQVYVNANVTISAIVGAALDVLCVVIDLCLNIVLGVAVSA